MIVPPRATNRCRKKRASARGSPFSAVDEQEGRLRPEVLASNVGDRTRLGVVAVRGHEEVVAHAAGERRQSRPGRDERDAGALGHRPGGKRERRVVESAERDHPPSSINLFTARATALGLLRLSAATILTRRLRTPPRRLICAAARRMPARPGDPIDPKPPLSLKTAPIRIGSTAAEALAWTPPPARSANVAMTVHLRKTITLLALVVAVGAAVTASVSAAGGEGTQRSDTRIVTVVKVRGLAWFDRMRTGIRRFAARTGVDATMTAARDASPRKQAAIIRRLIARRPDAITVVPNNPAALERVLARARRAGIVVVTHEASNQRNTDVDIEPFDNRAFGAHLMDKLAGCMGGSGTYVAFVGHRSAQSHREWVRGAEARAKARYPGHPAHRPRRWRASRTRTSPTGRPRPCSRRTPTSRASRAAPPRMSPASAAPSARPVARTRPASWERPRPRTVGSLLTDGSVDRIFLWDPALAGQAQDKLALRLLEGRRVGPGLNLHLPGYRNLKRIAGSPHGLHGSAWIDIDRANARKFPF